MVSRRQILFATSALVFAVPAFAQIAWAQGDFPTRPVTILIGNAPGGDDDTLSRFIAEQAHSALGQPIIVENRGGGATTVAGATLASSQPDGYRLLCLTTSGIVQTVLRDNLQYGLDDFAPVVGIGGYPMALVVSGDSEIDSIEDLIAVAKSPDGISFGSAGPGTLAHLTAVRFLNEIAGTGIHVSFKNNPEALQSLAGGFIQMMFPSAREAAVMSADGRLRVLAVTAPHRVPNLPDVPTMTELGYPDIDSTLWYGYMAPAGTPEPIIARLAEVISASVQSATFRDKFIPLSFQERLLTGQELRDFMTSQAKRWDSVIKENNVKITD